MNYSIVGIDFGTTNSCISFINKESIPVVLTNSEGKKTTPTIVQINGVEIANIKRLIGVKYNDIINISNISDFFNQRGIDIVECDSYCGVKIGDKIVSIKDLTIDYIKYLLDFVNCNAKSIVITVPVHFNNIQRNFLKDCCHTLGLNVLRILNEPTAASLAYGFSKSNTTTCTTTLVIDCGGGTTDVSIVNMDYESQIFQVKETNGDNLLGGEDINDIIYNHIVSSVLRNIRLSKRQISKLYTGIETLKKQLSFNHNATMYIENFDNEMDFKFTLSQFKFVSICEKFFKRIEKIIKSVGYLECNEVILVGGTTRIPYFKTLCEYIFPNNITILDNIDPHHTISIGAAYQGFLLENKSIEQPLLLDVTTLPLGIEIDGGIMQTIIQKNTLVPVTKIEVFTNANDNVSEIDIEIFQGDDIFVCDNKKISTLKIHNLDNTLERGKMKITIEFTLNVDGLLLVKISDQSDNKSFFQLTI